VQAGTGSINRHILCYGGRKATQTITAQMQNWLDHHHNALWTILQCYAVALWMLVSAADGELPIAGLTPDGAGNFCGSTPLVGGGPSNSYTDQGRSRPWNEGSEAKTWMSLVLMTHNIKKPESCDSGFGDQFASSS
jgi:hypothetical protein